MNTNSIAKEANALIERARRGELEKTCRLCGRPADFFGVFVPNNETAQRIRKLMVLYGICDLCRMVPGHMERMEDLIIRALQVH